MSNMQGGFRSLCGIWVSEVKSSLGVGRDKETHLLPYDEDIGNIHE